MPARVSFVRYTAPFAALLVATDAGAATPIGGGGGAAWSDAATCAAGPVTGVNLSAGSEVDRVRFSYGGAWAAPHGGAGGQETSFFLHADETVVEVRYRAGSRVDQLGFVTSEGRVFGPYGGGGGSPAVARAPAGQSLRCVEGRSGSKIDQISLTWGAVPTKASGQGSSASGLSTKTICTAGATASGGGGVSGNNVQGGGSVGVGTRCTTTAGYADPNGYVQVQLTCQSGMYASAQGQAGANGVSLCADASSGDLCTAGVAAGGTSQYGGGGGSAGVSGGAAESAGLCGGVTFGKGAVGISMCGTLAYDVGVDVCINGSVSYRNIYGRAEPFASRAAAQAAKCAASGTAAETCTFTVGDLMANAAAPFIGRTRELFDSGKRFQADVASEVWRDAGAVGYRAHRYEVAARSFAGNGLTATAYTATGQVLDASNHVVDAGKKDRKSVV